MPAPFTVLVRFWMALAVKVTLPELSIETVAQCELIKVLCCVLLEAMSKGTLSHFCGAGVPDITSDRGTEYCFLPKILKNLLYFMAYYLIKYANMIDFIRFYFQRINLMLVDIFYQIR